MITAALGKARSLLIFDKERQPLSADETAATIYRKLRESYKGFRAWPLAETSAIYIFFDLNLLPGQVPPEGIKPFYKVRRLKHRPRCYFICTNLVLPEPTMQILSFFVQDLILPIDATNWYCHNEADLTVELQQLLTQKFGISFRKLPAKCDGGTLQRGLQNGNAYLLAGNAPFVRLNDTELSHFFDIGDEARVVRVIPRHANPKVEQLLYHLDVYLSIVGRMDLSFDSNPDLVIVGEPWGADPLKTDMSEALDVCAADLRCNQELSFLVVRLPVLIIDISSTPFLLTYTNCHVQNIRKRNKRIISICFPAYTEPLIEKANAWLKMENFEALFEFRQQIQACLDTAKLRKGPRAGYNPGKTSRRLPETFMPELYSEIKQVVKLAEQEVRKRLAPLNSINVYFVDGPFTETSDGRHGSLHCISLVIERGPEE